ncbi:MAG: SDR family oxidoreductase [Bacteroidia bacterium]|nr:SDR family oxidoreductase [Bacteroidia bacterium]NNF29994.1 SDR family oxidoreductase [Flavobacteriaceae bacterium]MBT8276026.1 SDR family oxidoreductase [Bacteroidia bacterium]NNJ83198.1 SDR family oxidoreductase [Flavobacteriaceae bacterium]NNK53699.1 SDR family oxidoreductase [Flavobacteriaceae bacterium]
MNDIKGKVALITGGTKGIGYGIAEALMRKGVHVAITGRGEVSAQKSAQELMKSINGTVRAIGLSADVRDYPSQESAMRAVMAEFGKIDVVVANAGIGHFGSVESLTTKQWQETIDTNLTGAFYSLKATLDALKESKGYYISISSLAGTNFFAGGSAYNASKFGLTGFTQAAMLDLRKYGIKVSTIMPGSVATYFNDHVPNEKDSWKIQIEDIGKLVVDLLEMHPRTLPSKIEVRPSIPPSAKA